MPEIVKLWKNLSGLSGFFSCISMQVFKFFSGILNFLPTFLKFLQFFPTFIFIYLEKILQLDWAIPTKSCIPSHQKLKSVETSIWNKLCICFWVKSVTNFDLKHFFSNLKQTTHWEKKIDFFRFFSRWRSRVLKKQGVGRGVEAFPACVIPHTPLLFISFATWLFYGAIL